MKNVKENSTRKENEPGIVGKELHAHLSGSINPSDIYDIILQNDLHVKERDRINSVTQAFGIRLADKISADPQEAKQRFAKAYICIPNGMNQFSEVMARFGLTGFLLQFPEIRPQVAKSACEDFRRNGVNYVEWRIDPFSSTQNESAEEGYKKLSDFYSGMKSVDLVSKFVLSFQKSRYLKSDRTVDQTKIDFLTKQLEKLLEIGKELPIVGVDFSGDEAVLLRYFNEIFDLARVRGLGIAPHAGEGEASTLEDGLADIETALDVGAKRVGHAIVAYDTLDKYFNSKDRLGGLYDRQRIERLKDRQEQITERLKKGRVAVEVCPTSNLIAHFGLKSFEEHPLDRLVEAKVPFVICSDDAGIFATSLKREIIGISRAKNLNSQQLIETADRFGYDTKI